MGYKGQLETGSESVGKNLGSIVWWLIFMVNLIRFRVAMET